MKLCIRAHDLGVSGSEQILGELNRLGLDGVQLVCYKAYPDIPQQPGAITPQRAEEIGRDFAAAGKSIPLVGAYFNPIHADRKKADQCIAIFSDYLRVCKAMCCMWTAASWPTSASSPEQNGSGFRRNVP